MINNTCVWVVIPNWNGADIILDCLRSLSLQTQKHHTVVVDNGSIDNSIALITKNYPEVTILKNQKNLGFSGGVNVGIKHAINNNADYIALLNNDAIADRVWLEKMIKLATNHPEAGAIACIMLRENGKIIDSSGEQYSRWGFPYARNRNDKYNPADFRVEQIFGASGGASLYRTSTLVEIGLFDERFFAYYEDVDISFRMQLSGWKIMLEPAATVRHKISATSSKHGDLTRFHATKNLHMLFLKNLPLQLLLLYSPLFIIRSSLLLLSSTLHGKLHVWFKAYFVFLGYVPELLKDRKAIQKNRKVRVQYINSMLTNRFR